MDQNDRLVGRTHTDLYKSPGYLRTLGGKGGIKLTYLSPNGVAYRQLGGFVAVAAVWSAPLLAAGLDPFWAGGMGLAVIFGPPIAVGYLTTKPLPHGKTLIQWCRSILRHFLSEQSSYTAGKPTPTVHATIHASIWTPRQEGLHG